MGAASLYTKRTHNPFRSLHDSRRSGVERPPASAATPFGRGVATSSASAPPRQTAPGVVHVAERGYGSALLAGIRAPHGKYVIMGDSDDSYDFSRLDAFVEQLRVGYQIVMGNRFRGGIEPGAMPPMHR
jgi:hypothetical protein